MDQGHSETQFKAFISSHMQWKKAHPDSDYRPVVTISREAGAGGVTVGNILAELMEKKLHLKRHSWSVFEKELTHKALEHHNLPKNFAAYMPEDKVSHVKNIVEELVGLHPSQWTLVQKTTETIVYLAEIGNAILIGRGSNIVTRRMPHVFHVRLVGSYAKRSLHLMDKWGFTSDQAATYIREQDTARRNYVKANYLKDVDDPKLYHIVINTGLVTHAEAAHLIAHEVMRRAHQRLVDVTA